jgi:hypothetical protein
MKQIVDAVESEIPKVMAITANCALRTLPSIVDGSFISQSHERLDMFVSVVAKPRF